MTQQYKIEGMTCQNCVRRVKTAVQTIPNIGDFSVQLESPQLEISSPSKIDLNKLKLVLGKYSVDAISKDIEPSLVNEKSIETYKPLFIILVFLIGVTLLVQYPFNTFDGMEWMRHFMAGFFLVFSFFKLLNISGFVETYSMYDIVAKKWKGWGYVYPFVELTLGLLYLINIFPVPTNVATILILGISSIGVIQSVFNKSEIKCACLGDVFNLPMSTITIIEDVSMVIMAIAMLLVHH